MRARQARGYTLVELIIVVVVLAVIAAIAVPAATSDPKKLDLAASKFAAAIRFARSESLRTGEAHGFRQQSSAKRIRVFRLDQGTSPATLVYDVYHPVDKQLYDIDLNLESLAAVDSVNLTATFRGTCNQHGNIFFDNNGTPWCADPGTTLVDSFQVDLLSGFSGRTITLDAITGRVTIQ